ncbi:twin-arginine translocase subunit TatC [Taibaiella koreensis]|uniref:twin-arginine translocase subunit TatC n=1 Tax=Taibaiella koreensis TaxID=1268548 RepID=UPI001F0911DE|nr:twin-arginine translocase subunit TatC [Taibaiella koreensis]
MSILNKFLAKRNGGNPTGEMGFTDHIEALRWHLVRSLVAIIIGAVVVFFNVEWIFEHIIMGPTSSNFISYRLLCDLGKAIHVDALCLSDVKLRFQNNQLSGQFMMSFSISFMLGFIVAFPYVFWEFWKFVKPALKASELKYARGIVFWSSTLFFLGVAFAYFLIAPFTINFFAGYQLSPQFENIITIDNYYDTMSDLILGLGIVFELPIIVYFLSRIGILTPKIMRDQRRIAIVVIMVLAAVITPPDWFSIFLVAIPLVLLYEAGIVVSARILKEKKKKENETLDW